MLVNHGGVSIPVDCYFNGFDRKNGKVIMSKMNDEKFRLILEDAKIKSKNAFLTFVKSIYGVDEEIFEHLWDIPIIDDCELDSLITEPFGEKTEEDMVDIMWEIYEENLVDSKTNKRAESIADYIDLSSTEVIDGLDLLEWNKVSLSKINAVIVYNGDLIRKGIKQDEIRLSQEELETKYLNLLKETIIHELIHANAQSIIFSLGIGDSQKKLEIKDKNSEEARREYRKQWEAEHTKLTKKEFHERLEDSIFSNSINGAEVTYDNLDNDVEKWNDNNEVLVEATMRMIANYEKGDSLENCLYKALQKRNGKKYMLMLMMFLYCVLIYFLQKN